MKALLYFILVIALTGCKQLSIDDIDADNIFHKLNGEGKLSTISEYGIDQFQPWSRFFYLPDQMGNSDEIIVSNEVNATLNSRHISIKHIPTNTYFDFVYIGDKIRDMTVTNYGGIPAGERAIDFLIREMGFTYKKTNRINGVDQLLKKQEDENFFNCSVIRGNNGPTIMMFRILSKKK